MIMSGDATYESIDEARKSIIKAFDLVIKDRRVEFKKNNIPKDQQQNHIVLLEEKKVSAIASFKTSIASCEMNYFGESDEDLEYDEEYEYNDECESESHSEDHCECRL